MKLRFLQIAAIAVLLSLSSCGESDSKEAKENRLAEYRGEVADLQAKISELEDELGEGDEIVKKLRPVVVDKAVLQTFEHFVEVQGNVESEQNVMVHPEVPGTLLTVSAKEGQKISQGQILASIDAESLKRNIAEMQTRLQLAQTLFERQDNLWKQKIGSEIQYLQAKNNKEALEQSLAALKSQASKSEIRSPISGTVDEIFANRGETANPAMPFCRIVNLNSVEISADISEAYLRNVKTGDSINVFFPSLELERRVKLSQTGQFINPSNRTFRVKAKLQNGDEMLKPNVSAVVRIRDFKQENAVVISSQLIRQSADGVFYVYLVRDEKGAQTVRKTEVVPGKTYKGNTLVAEGLKAGDRLILQGYNEVTEGEIVEVLK